MKVTILAVKFEFLRLYFTCRVRGVYRLDFEWCIQVLSSTTNIENISTLVRPIWQSGNYGFGDIQLHSYDNPLFHLTFMYIKLLI